MTKSGWRKPTPALGLAEQLARDGEQKCVAKTRAIVAAKRVGAHIGLKAADLLLLDTLAAFTQPQDWGAGRRPIVWASNAYLMEQTGFSLSTLKRHARRLVEVGIIAFQDSPNGKRWGRRDAQGEIVEAYGFDLAPLCARAEELEAIAAQLSAERTLCQRLKRQITIARRCIRARLDVAEKADWTDGGWNDLRETFETLLEKLPRAQIGSHVLMALFDMFSQLRTRVEGAFMKASECVEENTAPVCKSDMHYSKKAILTPRQTSSEPHIRITNQLQSLECNSTQKKSTAHQRPEVMIAKPKTEKTTNKEHEPIDPVPDRSLVEVELSTILQACPEFTSWGRNLGGYIRDWHDFVRVAEQLAPMIGVSAQSWTHAQFHVGRHAAAAALALVFEKVHTGEVTSPGGYLLGMIRKARSGELHLGRSFYGRLNGLAA